MRLLSQVSYRDQEITGPGVRGLLALLADRLATGCTTAQLVAGLWPEQRPDHPAKAVQVLVSRARSRLGADLIASTPDGYRLSATAEQVDAAALLIRASASARHARSGDPAAALAEAEAGLSLWPGGPSVEDDADDPVSVLRAGRAATHRSLVRGRALALARLGRADQAVEALTPLALDHPQDEEILLELLSAEAATTGPAAALARYEGYRRALRDDLGTDPGPALQTRYQDLLRATAAPVSRGVQEEPNQLLGRDDDLAAVTKLLLNSRVTSIVGPGGLGKTRLAQALARQADQRIVHVVALAGVSADADVAREVALSVDTAEFRSGPGGSRSAHPDAVGTIVSALGSGPALLVLDNCEQVVPGVAALVQTLVALTRDLRVLTTSRARLGLSSESVYLLPELDQVTTVALFEQRARAARPGVDLPTDAVAQVCARLDGLPLAVELAAARVRVLSVTEIARLLTDRFALLRGNTRDAPERHRTLQAVVDWSWALLEEDDRRAMRALTIFPDGFGVDAARHLLGGSESGSESADVLAVLETLVDQSLLKVVETGSGARFRMLETVREFAAARRDAAGETEPLFAAFRSWTVAFAQERHDVLLGPDPFTSIGPIRAEQDTLVHALRHGLDRVDRAVVAAATAVLAGLWTVESNHLRMQELIAESAGALSRFRPGPELVEVTRTALTLTTEYAFVIEKPRATRTLVALRRLPPAPPTSLVRACDVLLRIAPQDPAALPGLGDSDEPLVAGLAHAVLSYLHEGRSDAEQALTASRRMLARLECHPFPWVVAMARTRVSELCLQVEEGDEARRHLAEALSVFKGLGLPTEVIGTHWWLVLACLQVGDVAGAEAWLDRTPPSSDENIYYRSYGLAVRAEIALARGQIETGLGRWRQASDELNQAGAALAEADDPPGLGAWTSEALSATVIAHAHQRQLHLIPALTADLPGRLTRMLQDAPANPAPFVLQLPVCGSMLLALAMVDLERGRRTGDARTTARGARAVALAERFVYLRTFQPTMSSTRARQAAEDGDRTAYRDAVATYATTSPDDLRTTALDLISAR